MIPVAEFLPLLPAGTTLLVGPASGTVGTVRGLVGPPEHVGRLLGSGDGAVVLLTPVERFDARFDVLLRRAASAGVPVLVVGVSDGTPLPGAEIGRGSGRARVFRERSMRAARALREEP
ncbi:hypothetical protein, partial [Curtobacterium sp. HSID17257]|uniref:hypothetical protein n=1 Tax=Curtobacterium sp. HSID17257 TaxID=2419510 RepID=UPI000FAA2594